MKTKIGWQNYLQKVLWVVFLALTFRTFVMTGYLVTSDEMAPQFLPNDYLVVGLFSYGVNLPLMREKVFKEPPQHGDFVVTYSSHLGQVLALDGDRVEVQKGVVSVNEKVLKNTLSSDIELKPMVVAPGQTLLLKYRGDSLNSLLQSEKIESIRGKVLLIGFSLAQPHRFFKKL